MEETASQNRWPPSLYFSPSSSYPVSWSMWRHSEMDLKQLILWSRWYLVVRSSNGWVPRRDNRDLPTLLPLPHNHPPPLSGCCFCYCCCHTEIGGPRGWLMQPFPPRHAALMKLLSGDASLPHMTGMGVVVLVPSTFSLLLLCCPPSLVKGITKEEQVEIWVHGKMISRNERKTFLQRRAATQNGAARCGDYLGGGLVWDGVGRNVSGVGRFGRGARSWALRNFPLVVLPTKRDKWELWSRMRGKINSKEVDSKYLKGGYLA